MNRRSLFKMLFGGAAAAVIVRKLPAAEPAFEWTEYPAARHMCFQNFMSPSDDLEQYARYLKPGPIVYAGPDFFAVQNEEWTTFPLRTDLVELLEARIKAADARAVDSVAREWFKVRNPI